MGWGLGVEKWGKMRGSPRLFPNTLHGMIDEYLTTGSEGIPRTSTHSQCLIFDQYFAKSKLGLCAGTWQLRHDFSPAGGIFTTVGLEACAAPGP